MTVCRSVSWVMVQRIGPAPKRKNEVAASAPLGQKMVAAITSEASTDVKGPRPTARPKGRACSTRAVVDLPTATDPATPMI